MDAELCRRVELDELTGRLVASYADLGMIRPRGRPAFPSLESIVEIARDVRELLFPDYHQRDPHVRRVADRTRNGLEGLLRRLREQFARALAHEQSGTLGSGDIERVAASTESCGPWLALTEQQTGDLDALAEQKAIAFLQAIPEIREVLATDVRMAFDGDPAARSCDEIICCYPGFEAVTMHRLAHAMHRLGVPLVPRMLAEWAHGRTGIDIHPGAEIGPAFFIDHGTGVVIGETCRIAARVKLYQGVTLGAISFEKDSRGNVIRGRKRHPTIHEGVVIYANATILGGKTIVGRNSVIGAGVSLNRSVPPDTIVTREKSQLRFREAA